MANVPDPVPFDPWEPFVAPLVAALVARLAAHGVHLDPEAVRAQLNLGAGNQADASFALHRWAKTLNVPGADLARTLADGFPRPSTVSSVQATGPYLNFRAEPLWLVRSTLDLVIAQGARYGRRPPGGPSVCVEHTSANPTGPFHIGRVRNGLIGDTLARVLRADGRSVTTQYYVDDVGRQAAMITWIWSKPPSTWPEEVRATVPDPSPSPPPGVKPDLHFGRPYPAVSTYLKTHPEARDEVQELSRRLEAGEAPGRHHDLSAAILGGMVESLARVGIHFDEFVWESSFLKDGSVDRIVERLSKGPHAVREENGALAFDASSYGLPKETARVIVTRGDGTSLYPTRDLAYHLAKFARFPRVIDVLGQDHQLHARTLDAMLAEVGETRRPEFVIYQDITVPEGGRMSSRKGSAVYLDDLLDEAVDRARREVLDRREDLGPDEVESIATRVAAGAVRYHILRVAPEKTVGFRWEDALSFEGRSGPFLQYAYARASSLLRKSGESAPTEFRAEELMGSAELALVRAVARLPGVVSYVAKTNHVHTIAGYAHDLAEEFNRFYQVVPVLSAGAERASRLAMVGATRQALATTLDLLGVDALERM